MSKGRGNLKKTGAVSMVWVVYMASDKGQGRVKGERGSVKEKGACERAGAVSSVGC